MTEDLNQDYQDLLRSLTAHRVEFLVVGAYALAFHGVARYTEDLDIWMARTESNAQKLKAALEDFRIGLSADHVRQLLLERKFLRFGNPRHKVEILNFLDGCEFESAAARSVIGGLGGVDVPVLGLEDYVNTKRASARPKDTSDLDLLRNRIGPLPGDE
jgi:hypothetical protein